MRENNKGKKMKAHRKDEEESVWRELKVEIAEITELIVSINEIDSPEEGGVKEGLKELDD